MNPHFTLTRSLHIFEFRSYFGMEYDRPRNMGKKLLDTLLRENAQWPELRPYFPETFLYASLSFTSAHQQAASVRAQQLCLKLSHDESFFMGRWRMLAWLARFPSHESPAIAISCFSWSGLRLRGCSHSKASRRNPVVPGTGVIKAVDIAQCEVLYFQEILYEVKPVELEEWQTRRETPMASKLWKDCCMLGAKVWRLEDT